MPLVDRRSLLVGTASALVVAPCLAHAGGADPDARPAWQAYFAEAGTEGVVGFAGPQGPVLVSETANAGTEVRPASTFKVAHALIALEAGVVTPDERFRWDGIGRTLGGKSIAVWNQDQTMREAFSRSTIWVFQEIARRIGPERMAKSVSAFDYGNRNLSDAPIDQFWLAGNLRISVLQQIAFLQKLWAGELPASPANMALVRDLMRLESGEGYTLYGKTGLLPDEVGWFAGVIERQAGAHTFALQMRVDNSDAMAKSRIAIVKRAAADLGLIPPV